MPTGNTVLRELRTTLKLTQRQMARETKLSAGYICQLERGIEQIGHKAGLAIFDTYRPQMAEMRLTLDELLRGRRHDAAA